MSPYGSLRSPSTSKMNSNVGVQSPDRRRTSKMRMENILGDPFALATLSIATMAWLIALISSIVAAIGDSHNVRNYSWFAVAYMFCCIVGVFIVIASNTLATYRVAIVGFLAAAIILCSSATDSLIYTSNGAKEAASAGHMLLTMVAIVWLFYFGSDPSAASRAYLDSFALHKDAGPARSGRVMSHAYGAGRPPTSVSHQAPQMYTSAQLNGFETSPPLQSGFTNVPMGDDRASAQPHFNSRSAAVNSTIGTPNQAAEQPGSDMVAPAEYPYKAKAIYSYEANPDDANEISFSKHEILEVSDVSGRWWQAKKATGDTGIAPSNYLILL